MKKIDINLNCEMKFYNASKGSTKNKIKKLLLLWNLNQLIQYLELMKIKQFNKKY